MTWRVPPRMVVGAGVIVGLLVRPAVSMAQAPAPAGGRVEMAVTGLFTGGYGLGARSADLTSNVVPRGRAFPLFEARTRARSATFVELHLGYRLARDVTAEGSATYGRPGLETAISGDSETGEMRLTTRVLQYGVDAGLRLDLPQLAFAGGHGLPFATGGAGYVRELSEARTAVESGLRYHVGAGVRYLVGSGPGFIRTWGLRSEVRIHVRRRGIDVDDRARVYGSAAAGLFVSL